MKLSDYLAEQKMSAADFAKRLKEASCGTVGVTEEAVRLWITGARRPRPGAMSAITALTGSRVRPNDFYEAA